MQDMEAKPITDRKSVECPACKNISFNPKFLPEDQRKAAKELMIFYEKDYFIIQNDLWEHMEFIQMVCKKCGNIFGIPIRHWNDDEWELHIKEMKDSAKILVK